MSDAPTQRQLEVLRLIRDTTALQRGIPPTVRELREALSLKSNNAVADHLKALMKRELLEYGARRVVLLTPLGRRWLRVAAGALSADGSERP